MSDESAPPRGMNDAMPWRSGFAAIGAIVVAAIVGVLLVSAFFGHFDPAALPVLTIYIGLPFAGAHALFVGAPLYALARTRWALNWSSAAIGGAATGIIPATVVFATHLLPALFEREPIDFYALTTLALFGFSGGAGGLAYRALHGPGTRSARAA